MKRLDRPDVHAICVCSSVWARSFGYSAPTSIVLRNDDIVVIRIEKSNDNLIQRQHVGLCKTCRRDALWLATNGTGRNRLPRLASCVGLSSRPPPTFSPLNDASWTRDRRVRERVRVRVLYCERHCSPKTMASTDNGVLSSAPTAGMPSSQGEDVGVSDVTSLKGTETATAPNMVPGFGIGSATSESPDASKSNPDTSGRSWPPSLPPLPPHLMGADLPIANISRIMKRALPDNGKIAKNAKECMQECVSELISFVTSEASDRCGSEKRKTINGDDILYSLRVLGFDNYEQVLKVYLSRYRQAQEENPRQRRRRAMKRRSSPASLHESLVGEGEFPAPHDEDAQEDDDEDAVSEDAGEDE